MTAAILSTKTKRFFDLAVGSELFEGQKIKDFQEKKTNCVEFQNERKQIQAKNLSCLIEETPDLQLMLVILYLVPDPNFIEPCAVQK